MVSQSEQEYRANRRRIGELAEEWRSIAAALPFWRIDHSGPEVVIIATDLNQPLATLHGMWAPNMARFLTAMGKQSGVPLAELLWRIGGHGDADAITDASLALVRTLGLERPRERYRPR